VGAFGTHATRDAWGGPYSTCLLTSVPLTPPSLLRGGDKEIGKVFWAKMRLWLSVMAYNLGNLWRRLVLLKRIDNWSLTSLHQRLVKTGGRLVKHARNYWLLLAESHLTRRLFGSMVRRIAALPGPVG
jgi:Transposase DDE domain group 1